MISCIEQLTHTFRDDMELHFHNAIKVGANMVEFAIRSLSTMVYIKRVDSGQTPFGQTPSCIRAITCHP